MKLKNLLKRSIIFAVFSNIVVLVSIVFIGCANDPLPEPVEICHDRKDNNDDGKIDEGCCPQKCIDGFDFLVRDAMIALDGKSFTTYGATCNTLISSDPLGLEVFVYEGEGDSGDHEMRFGFGTKDSPVCEGEFREIGGNESVFSEEITQEEANSCGFELARRGKQLLMDEEIDLDLVGIECNLFVPDSETTE